jgi:DNA-binding response OmpR family regulator
MISPNWTIGVSMDPTTVVGILHVTPVEADCSHLRSILRHPNWQLHRIRCCRDARALIHSRLIAIVLCEAILPDGDWKHMLEETRSAPGAPRLIVSSRLADERLWAEVLNLGGWDVLATPFETGEVVRVLFSAYFSRVQTSALRQPPNVADSLAFGGRGLVAAAGGR